MIGRYLLVAMLVSLAAVAFANAYTVGTASIPAVAVIPDNGGSLVTMNLTVTSGTGNVVVVGPATVGSDTLQSAQTAAQYASTYLGLNFSKYNFTYTILSADTDVTGPSGGAPMTLLAISALSNKKLRSDFTATGTINSDGSIGEIGGVYNKVDAAVQDGLRFVLVPDATYSGESKLYLLAQTEFGMPLVQVANITQASTFAFNTNVNALQHQFVYNLSTNYSVNNLPQAAASCTNQCSEDAFAALANYTIRNTRSMIGQLGSNRFRNISTQLGEALTQSSDAYSHGYFYVAANMAFLDYLNAYYFNAHDTTKSLTLSDLENIQALCSSLVQPQITTTNYEYVMGAELRSEWGEWTINQTLSTYNTTATDTDTVLNNVYVGAEAKAWCNAAGFTYGYFANSTGTPISFLPTLSSIAMERLNRDSQYGYSGMYFYTAQQAYKDSNYPLAMLGADYDFAISNATASGDSLTTQQLLSATQSAVQNSTYGAWATEFTKEAQFYAYQSGATSNATQAHSYAVEAYTSALLAQQVGTDMKVVYNNSVSSINNYTCNTAQQTALLTAAMDQLAMMDKLMVILLAVGVLTLSANLAMIAILIKRSSSKENKRKVRRKAPKVPRRRRRRR